jgi:hypothetical protein
MSVSEAFGNTDLEYEDMIWLCTEWYEGLLGCGSFPAGLGVMLGDIDSCTTSTAFKVDQICTLGVSCTLHSRNGHINRRLED